MSSLGRLAPLTYRRISKADLAIVESLDLDPDQVAQFLGPLPEILDTVRRGPAHSLVGVESAGALIGFFVLHPDRRDASCWWLGWLAIATPHQGFGHGRAILAAVMARLARIPGCRRVRLLVDAGNHGARRLYARSGFRPLLAEPGRGEHVLECGLGGEVASGFALPRRVPDHLRLRPRTGPHAARMIGVVRGPPVRADRRAQGGLVRV